MVGGRGRSEEQEPMRSIKAQVIVQDSNSKSYQVRAWLKQKAESNTTRERAETIS